jgi:hypothetical protein
MRTVLSSASEAEIGALFENCKKAAILCITLDELGYTQPATPIQTDNSTACGIANDNIKQQRSRAIDMRFYWVRDRVQQGQFILYWGPGQLNLADYYNKHHSAAHHRDVRPKYLYMGHIEATKVGLADTMQVLRGCVKPSAPAPAGCTDNTIHPSAPEPASFTRVTGHTIQNLQAITQAIQAKLLANNKANSSWQHMTMTS